MRKSVTPVVATTLLVMMVIVVSVLAFIWISSVQLRLQERAGGSVNTGISSCSRINIISMRGDRIVIQNTGCDTINNVTLLIDGVLTEYDLSAPLAPGGSATITYTALSSGDDHSIRVALDNGFVSDISGLASQNSPESGYYETWLDACGDSTIVNLYDKILFDEGDEFSCTCSNTTNLLVNPGFESDLNGWDCMTPSGCAVNSSIFHSGTKSASLNNTLISQGFNGLVTKVDFYAYSLPNNFFETNGMAVLYVVYDDGVTGKSINYLLDYEGSSVSNCGAYSIALLGEDTYYDCSYAKDFYNSWTSFTMDEVYEDIQAAFPDSNLSEYTHTYVMFLIVDSDYSLVDGYMLLDDVYVYIAPELKYCNKRNSGGFADGVCFKGSCVSAVNFGFKNTPSLLSSFADSNFTTYFKNASQVACQLSAGGNYPMTISGAKANVSASLSAGSYLSTISCSTSDYTSSVSRAINVTNWDIDKRLTNDAVYSYFPVVYASGSNVHIVWQDYRDGSEAEVYYKKSVNNGATWSSDTRISDNVANLNIQLLKFAGSGDKMHAVWEQSSNIFYLNSTDNGVTWSSEYQLTSSGGYYPSIAVQDDNVYLAFIKNNDVYIKNSSNSGAVWSSEQQVTSLVSQKQHPNLAVSENNIHIVWWDNRDATQDLFYKTSADLGVTWSSDYKIVSDSSPYQNIKVLSEDSTVYVFWSDSVNRTIGFRKSTNNGTTWDSPKYIIYAGNVLEFDAALSGNNLYLVYSDDVYTNDLFFMQSSDAGASWTNPLRLFREAGDSSWPVISSSGGNIHIVWEDRRDNTYYEVYYKRFVP